VPRVAGIDPGTVSIDVCVLHDGEPFLEASLPASEVAAGPSSLLALLRQAAPLDLIAGPSGYGLPLVSIAALEERDLRLLCLAEPGAGSGIGGIRTLVRSLREARLPVVFTPGVVHLPTVPAHRKANRVDMGTADKVCAAAFAIHDQAQRLGIPCRETSFILAELGGAFSAVLSVEGGRIVSGQGGSSGPMGYRAGGAMDAEAAFLLRSVTKATVFSGGAAFLAGQPDAAPEALGERNDAIAGGARDALVEGVLKAVAAEMAILPRPREILISGRLARVPAFADPVAAALSRLGVVRTLAPGRVKEAAVGAALVADGLAGGRHAELVAALGLRDAAGTCLDHLYLAGADTVREWASRAS
jgi:predicted butyrate kinase (DUF1464 family)